MSKSINVKSVTSLEYVYVEVTEKQYADGLEYFG